MKKYIKPIIAVLIGILAGAGGAAGIININTNEKGALVVESSFQITLPEATIAETEDGSIQVLDAPKVESIEGEQMASACPEGEEECGQGHYVYAPTESVSAFTNYVLGGCWDVDSAFGSQCWDLGALFWMNYTNDGRILSTCGTGAAKGAWDCKEINAGDEFELIYDAMQLQPGDWVIFGGGEWGHVGMALGGYENGYVALLGQNQGGVACPGGGSSANIINMNLGTFRGAFRPKSYIPPAPEPTPEPAIPISGCRDWHVLEGDTMSKIMLECEGTVVYGEPMNAYAKSWYSLVINPGQSVYDGWASPSGVGLYANDDIEHKIGE